jgi:hypothetical protein
MFKKGIIRIITVAKARVFFSTKISKSSLLELTEDSPYRFINYKPLTEVHSSEKLNDNLIEGFKMGYE